MRQYNLVKILDILEDKKTIHALNERGVFIGNKVYHISKDYYLVKDGLSRPLVFRAKLETE